MLLSYRQVLKGNVLFRLLWIAQSISLVGDWFNRIALLDYIAIHEDNRVYLGVVLVCSLLPQFILGPFAGVIIDRFSKKSILIISDLVRGYLVLVFLFISPDILWLLFIVEFLVFSASSFFLPAKLSILPVILTSDELGTANALGQMTWGIMLSLGALLGGIAITVFGFHIAIVVNSATFFMSAILISFIAVDEPQYNKSDYSQSISFLKKFWTDFKLGISYIIRDRFIIAILLVKPGWAIGGGAILTLHTVFARDVFDAGSFGIGILYMCRGLGVVLGSFVGKAIVGQSKVSVVWYIGFAFCLYGIFYGIFSIMPIISLGAIVLVFATISSSNLWLFTRVTLQKTIPPNLRGRVFAHDEGISTLFLMLSSLLAGLAINYFDPRYVALLCAFTIIVFGVLWIIGLIFNFIPKSPTE